MSSISLIQANILRTKQTEYAIEQWKKRLLAEEVAVLFYLFFGNTEKINLIGRCFETIKEKNLFRSILYAQICERTNIRSWRIYCRMRWHVSNRVIDALIEDDKRQDLIAA